MKNFWALLITITSLSAHTLAAVHASCPICPSSMGGLELHDGCTSQGITVCWYRKNEASSFRFCEYDSAGTLSPGGDYWCPTRVNTGTAPNCDSICYTSRRTA
ncbi:hypothetical protein PAXRUDRAFT_836221 [Paxillus rubicundulus Ve08.2h10]|uniref:Glucanase n=1 Tax=Paxillus rubicundulus Ve08.2h10 TaxID=930991 RepID=A0A0D0CS02_9AGAM|nr:hypothetical protein PAXRUDRAFT_836221 [Paxillus rubicundulus Ve08.2h10]